MRHHGLLWAAFVALVLETILGSRCPALAASSPAADCVRCRQAVVRRLLRSHNLTECREPGPRVDASRLIGALDRCRCSRAMDATAFVAAMHQLADAITGSICTGPVTVDPASDAPWGSVVDTDTISGPVGRAPLVVDPADAPSFDDVGAFCASHRDYDAPAPLLALPTVTDLPSWCDERQEYQEIVTTCGAPRILVVAADASHPAADGTAERPFTTIGDALAACGTACHILVAPGIYPESLDVRSCTIIEGGVQSVAGSVTRGAARPEVRGIVAAKGDAILLARIAIQDSGLAPDGDVLLSESVLRGGGLAVWGATGPRICRTHIAGGYGGFGLAWRSTRLWIAGSAISACYEAAAISWGSHDLKVIDSVLYGDYHAVGTSWGSTDVEVRGSRLGGRVAAVDVHLAPDDGQPLPASFDVRVIGNTIAFGSLPDDDPSRGIVVRDNVLE